MELLRKLSLLNKVVIAKVEGQVLAGGVGLCVACDFVMLRRAASLAYLKSFGAYFRPW